MASLVVQQDASARHVVIVVRLLCSQDPPEVQPSSRCKQNRSAKAGDRPSNCGHLERNSWCGKQLTQYWTFDLPRLSPNQASYLFDRGMFQTERLDVDDEGASWSVRQQTVIRCVQEDRSWLDVNALTAALAVLEWPISFMDFEFDPGIAIPRYSGTLIFLDDKTLQI